MKGDQQLTNPLIGVHSTIHLTTTARVLQPQQKLSEDESYNDKPEARDQYLYEGISTASADKNYHCVLYYLCSAPGLKSLSQRKIAG